MKMMDSRGSGFIVGEMGCIAGESEVYDPVAGLYRRVDQITEPFHVVAYDEANETLAVGKALTPFIKGRKELYRVTLEFGRSFLCTQDHVVLTRSGWKCLDQLVLGRENGDRLRAASSVGGIAAIGWEAVREIKYEHTDIYYDFTVEKYHNYVMAEPSEVAVGLDRPGRRTEGLRQRRWQVVSKLPAKEPQLQDSHRRS
jgi:hypothetical protein